MADTLQEIVTHLPRQFKVAAAPLHADLCALLIGLAARSVRERIAHDCETGQQAPSLALGTPGARTEAQAAESTEPPGLEQGLRSCSRWDALCQALHEAHIPTTTLHQLEATSSLTQHLSTSLANYFASWQQPGIEPLALGELNEALSSHYPLQARASSLQLKPAGVWICLRQLLEQAGPERATWLQAEASLSKSWVLKHAAPLRAARTEAELLQILSPQQTRVGARASAGQWLLQPSLDRRRQGAHYTPRELCAVVVHRTLAPVLAQARTSEKLLRLTVCDPAMGCGAFLLEAGEQLAKQLQRLLTEEGGRATLAQSRRRVLHCLHGVDRDPRAVQLARLALQWWSGQPGLLGFEQRLKHGDALVGADPHDCGNAPGIRRASRPRRIPMKGHGAPAEPLPTGFDWVSEFPCVFQRPRNGFDACLGNPPWVAFVGRAAQPLSPALAHYFTEHNPAFRQYKTLHGLFVVRSARLLAPGGRLGLVLPTSVADLQGYGPTRQAHDALCEVDDPLPDFGDGVFADVFQPSMALLSTRRRAAPPPALRRPASLCRHWPLERRDLNPEQARLLEKLDRLPKLPPELFGEWGFQTQAGDVALLTRRESAARIERAATFATTGAVPLHQGSDVCEFGLGPASLLIDPELVHGRLRSPDQWQRVALFVRQTARYPIAQRGDGQAFRNSLLACFARPPYDADLLVAYLNSALTRWFHYHRHRDARQGMPQVKIGHLRALPALPSVATPGARGLAALGASLATSNAGIRHEQRLELDQLVFAEFGLSAEERRVIAGWALASTPPGTVRKARASRGPASVELLERLHSSPGVAGAAVFR